MHELYIAECILGSVARSLPEGVNRSDVREVHVKIGRLDAVNSENLIFLFDSIKESKEMAGAKLLVSRIEIACRCRGCAREFKIEEPVFICPECGGGSVEVTSGRGVTLTEINIEDESSS